MIELAAAAKRYRIHFEKPSLVRSVLPLLARQARYREYWALHPTTLQVAPGECLGIVGANGSGKSTLLRLLAGVTRPTAGSVTCRGRVSSLLELGAGFHPELTGRENIYLNAALLGLTRRETTDLFERIVAFAHLDRFIDARLFTYSSGMAIRLGFAVAIHVPFDILLIDEIIAVGDLAFQEKCYAAIGGMLRRDKAIVVVSHSMAAIDRLCTRALWLDHGQVRDSGTVPDIIARFTAASAQMQ